MDLRILPISAGATHKYFSPLLEYLSKDNKRVLFRAGFAYVSLGGVQQLLASMTNCSGWEAARKEIIVGVHHAISEPSALEALRAIPNTKIRVFLPTGRLQEGTFDAKPVFHPKVLSISTIADRKIELIQAGSANLTVSALGESPKNFEFGLVCYGNDGKGLHSTRTFERWWSSLWQKSRKVDRGFIRRYAKLRGVILERNPILKTVSDTPESISQAKYLFVEVGAGSGPPGRRHQVEFPESLVKFFGRPQRRRRGLTLRRGGISWDGRPLSYKKTTYGVEIWRLGMPTQNSGGDPISFRAIRFERTKNKSTFNFELADVDDDKYREWVRLSNLDGHLGVTRGAGGRQYGFYGTFG